MPGSCELERCVDERPISASLLCWDPVSRLRKVEVWWLGMPLSALMLCWDLMIGLCELEGSCEIVRWLGLPFSVSLSCPGICNEQERFFLFPWLDHSGR